MGNHPRLDLFRQKRAEGKSYARIAKECGVSYQTVWNALSAAESGSFRPWTKERCIYPNLRNWLNENRCSPKGFVARMDLHNCPAAEQRIRGYFRGTAYPTKKVIDQMLQVTGLTYEQMWERDDE